MILIVGLSCLGLSEKSSVITILREGEPLLNLKTNHFDAGACVNGFPPCGACHFLFVVLLSHVIQLIIETGHYIFEFSSTNLPTSFYWLPCYRPSGTSVLFARYPKSIKHKKTKAYKKEARVSQFIVHPDTEALACHFPRIDNAEPTL